MIPFTAIVPARRDSQRLPDKPLADIGGVPMIVRVLRRARSSGAMRVVAAVDDDEIAEVVRAAGFEAQMTGECDSGSARVCEAARICEVSERTIVVNVQGDEPFVEPELVRAVAARLSESPACVCATAMRPPHSAEEFARPSAVKVVANAKGEALYFSRAVIPHADGDGEVPASARVHIGVYAYFPRFLRRLAALSPSAAEQCEQLEQLRILHHGESIAVAEFPSRSEGVDTPEDLTAARARAAAEED
ncbi:MAG: 3-deoxy-manno-octulosonate cytidylyltransferase [Gammaproteobacteria bacterium]